MVKIGVQLWKLSQN